MAKILNPSTQHLTPNTLVRLWAWKWRLLLLLLIAGITLGVAALNASRSAAPVQPVETAAAKPISVQAGVVPVQERKLAFRTNGVVGDVLVKPGDAVKTGDVVAKLQIPELELQLEVAKAGLALQQAMLAQDVKGAEESVATANAQLSGALAQFQRTLDGASASDLAAAEAAVRAAEAQLASAQQRLVDLRARPKPEDVRAAEIGVEQASNALWSQQISRDATCGRAGPEDASCKSADAAVGVQDAQVKAAVARLETARQPATAAEIEAAEQAARSAQAGVDSAGVRVAQLRGGPTAADRQAAQSQVDQARASLRSAQARLDQLKGGSSAADREAAKSALRQAEVTLDIGRARLLQAELAVQQAELALANAVLRAPFDGTVTSVGLKSGDVAAPNATALTLADLSDLRFETKDLDEINAAKVRVGQEVQVIIAALDKTRFRGTVTELAQQPTITQVGDVNYTATILLAEPAPGLKWGMTAKVEFTP